MLTRDLFNPLTKDEESKYGYHFANFNDRNGNGTAEIILTEINNHTSTITINGWSLNKNSIMNYDWGNTTIKLNVTDPNGKEKDLDAYGLGGSQSSYFRERVFWAMLGTFKRISSHKDWEHYNLVQEIEKAKSNLALLEQKLSDITNVN
jgi:hypothetical protein